LGRLGNFSPDVLQNEESDLREALENGKPVNDCEVDKNARVDHGWMGVLIR
jgi:hypothetical protein